MKVVYGHTDSIYVQIDSVEKAEKAIKQIEESVREHFPNVMGLDEHPVQLEFEKYYSALGVGTTKNRNAGLVSWEDGVWLDKPKFTMTGFTAKRVSETKLAKEVQTNTLTMWVENKSQAVITNYLHGVYSDTLNGKVPITSVIKRSRLRKDRLTVKCPDCNKKYSLKECQKLQELPYCTKCSCAVKKFVTLDNKTPSLGSGIAGVIYGWKNNIEFDDSYLFLKVKTNESWIHPLKHDRRNVEYISGATLKGFDNVKPDWKHYAEQVVDKAKPIYKAMGWDISSIRTNRIQASLEEWF